MANRLLALMVAALLLIGSAAGYAADPLNYEELYKGALEQIAEWQSTAVSMSAEIAKQKGLVQEALKLYEEAERDVDLLKADIVKLTTEIAVKDSMINMQAAQLKKLNAASNWAWLLGGLLVGAGAGVATTILVNK